MIRRLLLTAAAAAALAGAQQLPSYADITKSGGITFRHSYGDHHMDNIVEGTGAGVCLFDYNNDGFLDIYFVSGIWTKGVSDNEGRDLKGKLSNKLYKNNGNGSFTDVTATAGVDGKGIFSSACSAADYDNDGFVDLYVLNYGPNLLYHNNGNGTFTEVGEKAGLADTRWSLSGIWFDYDGDGWLDVYVCNYLKYDDGKFRDFYPAAGYPGPLSYNAEADALFRNNGNGTFTDITKEAGLYNEEGRGMSATVADFNGDGRLDIYVANDASERHYFERQANGKFVERAIEAGLAYGENGQNVASMGPFAGDLNRDGMLDVYVPDLNYNSLLIQVKPGMWEHRSAQSGLSQMMGQYAGWAGILLDYDNDGWLDIFTTHGNAHHEYVQEDTLARNKGSGSAFEDVSRKSGPYFFEKYVGRGAAWGDLDNDGDIDLVIVNINDSPKVLRNDGGNASNWLAVDASLKFPGGTRTALGARVIVTAGGKAQIEDLIPVRGYLSQGDHRLHFGLGANETADVEIRWPDGKAEKFEKVKSNQFLKLVHEAKAAAGGSNGAK